MPKGVYMAKGGMRGEGGMCVAKVACMAKGTCMAKGGMCSKGGKLGEERLAWQNGMHGRGVHGSGVHATHALPPANTMRYGDTVNERAVHILLECILVNNIFHIKHFLVFFCT